MDLMNLATQLFMKRSAAALAASMKAPFQVRLAAVTGISTWVRLCRS